MLIKKKIKIQMSMEQELFICNLNLPNFTQYQYLTYWVLWKYPRSVVYWKEHTLLMLLKMNTYRGFRNLFSLPCNGQRAWSNANSIKKTTSILLLLKQQQFNTYTHYAYSKTEVLAEYINYLWFIQWNYEWKTMKNNWMRHRNFRKNPLKNINFNEMVNFRMEHFSYKLLSLKKFKSHRKKIKFNKNIITGGFKFGFVAYYSKFSK